MVVDTLAPSQGASPAPLVVPSLPMARARLPLLLALLAPLVVTAGSPELFIFDTHIHPEWRALFLRHPDRFLAGTDTWVTSRWESLPGSVAEVRAYLAPLPREVAEQIAFRNAERLFPD